MTFIAIVETDDSFPYQPIDESTGQPYDSVLDLRIVSDKKNEELQKANTSQAWDKKSHRMVDRLNNFKYTEDLLDYAIVGWQGVKSATTGADLPCTPELKTRLPEKWKVEVIRLCLAKEAGDVVSKATEEKKLSAPISSSRLTS